MRKAGFVNIIGNPSVGKSALMNASVGEKLLIITSKAQTTRHHIFGIVSGDDFQVVFSDTLGIIKPAYTLQESIMAFVKDAFDGADILIYMVEIDEKELREGALFDRINKLNIPMLLPINKIDTSEQQVLEEQVAYWKEQAPRAEVYPISALRNFQTKEVFGRILTLLPESPAFFPKDQLTDKPERLFVNEIIREKISLYYKKEVPYSVEVTAESFTDSRTILHIRSVIVVERESQKGIIIGHKGEALKRVGIVARADLERFLGKQVHLELFVKVNKDWRSSERQLSRFGHASR